MNDEIKEINIKIPGQILDYVDTKDHLLDLFNYITNLQQRSVDIGEYNTLVNKYNEIFKENKNLKSQLKGTTHCCDEEEHKKLQQENERLKEKLEARRKICLEAVKREQDYKSRCEKASEYFKYQLENLDFYEDTKARMLCAMGITLLQNGSDSQ